MRLRELLRVVLRQIVLAFDYPTVVEPRKWPHPPAIPAFLLKPDLSAILGDDLVLKKSIRRNLNARRKATQALRDDGL